MEPREIEFHRLVAAAPPGPVVLTGGGGKTSLLFTLAKALAAAGERVLCTTTTRMLLPDADERLDVSLGDSPESLFAAPPKALYAALPPDADGGTRKVRGFAPERIDALSASGRFDRVLAEADGAAGRPLKAPAPHEPVVPSRTAVAVAVLGLGCLGKPFSPETVFRAEQVAAITGLSPGDILAPAAVARLAPHPDGMFKNIPAGAKRYLFCNQADIPGAEAAGRELAAAILDNHPGCVDGVVVASLRTGGLRCLFFPAA